MVGPNAVTQLANALRTMNPALAEAVFIGAGHGALLDTPPSAMIDEAVPAALFATTYDTLPPRMADKALRAAGVGTADYIIANRIPWFAKVLLRVLPNSVAAPLLLRAIQASAWTFAGSGTCKVEPGPSGQPHVISIKANPLAARDCVWHRAVFQRLFERLVGTNASVHHTACRHDGDAVCRFEIVLCTARHELATERQRGMK